MREQPLPCGRGSAMCVLGSIALGLVLLQGASAGQEGGQAPPPATQSAPEIATRDVPTVFQSRVNLVLVPVVVRDKQGKATGDLKREDFQLFDKGKLQEISKFSIERSGGNPGREAAASDTTGEQPSQPAARLVIPERFIAYVFDDIHLKFADMVYVRDAARRHLDTALRPTDRAAIYTTSGQTMQEFTDDRDELHETLNRLMPRPISGKAVMECPDLTYYVADLIVNKNDPQALQAAVAEVLSCDPYDSNPAMTARFAAQRELSLGEQESRVSFALLKDVVRRMSGMPGQRTMVLASPGFLKPDLQSEENDILDHAIRANVVINSLDARGLYTDSYLDASQYSLNMADAQLKSRYARWADAAQADVLAELSYGTGGAFFQNNNDMDEGYKLLAAAPEYIYLLGFSPQNLKLDGSFHALKVSLKTKGLALMARKGYYAPKHLEDPAETAKREIEESVFSREDLNELPVELHTQFFKTSDTNATVSVLADMDLKHIQLRKTDGRNCNVLTVVSALFDRNGNLVVATQKTLDMRLKDETVERLAASGVSLRTTFDVPPGSYGVRLVVRDSEGQMMSAENGVVEIP